MMRTIQYIFIHCTGTPRRTRMESLQRGFEARGWKRPGYHYVVEADGTLVRLCHEDLVCNGVAGYNQSAIHVAYVGGVDAEGRPADTRTTAQEETLEAVLKLLHWRYPHAEVLGHNEVNPHKACPSFSVKDSLLYRTIMAQDGRKWTGV